MRMKAFSLVALLVVGAMSTLSAFAGASGEAVVEPAAPLTANLTCQKQVSDVAFAIQINNNGPDKVAKGRYIIYKYKTVADGPEHTVRLLVDTDFPAGEWRVAVVPKLHWGTPVIQCSASVLTVKPIKIMD